MDHLRENMAVTHAGPLSAELLAALDAITSGWDHLSAQ